MKPAILRKNTPEIVSKLEELGFCWFSHYTNEPYIAAGLVNFRSQSDSVPDELTPFYISLQDEEDIENYVSHGYIDCGKDEELFFKLLQEDEN